MSIDPAVLARLREIADRLPQVPGTAKDGIAEGEIVMVMPAARRHEPAVLRIAQQLDAQLPHTHPGHLTHGGAGLEDAGPGRPRNPDPMVFPEAAPDDEAPALLPHEVLPVVEIVSRPAPENDHRTKVHGYATAGIPLPLLIDPRKGTGIVHDEPGYTSRTEFAFGDTVTVGPWTLHTGVLRTHA
ncbi:Uma2 family endonuclease [Kitasatospora indigofera]|uniref:Uma2 family endonuclease n=1 Tax=Kitasatospora indigofera TaxID=67307 RepID=UPI003688BE52